MNSWGDLGHSETGSGETDGQVLTKKNEGKRGSGNSVTSRSVGHVQG